MPLIRTHNPFKPGNPKIQISIFLYLLIYSSVTSLLLLSLSHCRVPAWPSRSRRPTSSAQLSSRRTVCATSSTWQHWRVSTRAAKAWSAARHRAAPKGSRTCLAGLTWLPWPLTCARTRPRAALSCDWLCSCGWGSDWGRAQREQGANQSLIRKGALSS